MGLGRFLRKHGGRIAAGVATGGLSEVVRKGENQYHAQPAPVTQAPGLMEGLQGAQTGAGEYAAMLSAQARGEGPNPALAQLQQTTEQNIRRTQGGIASQRGINPAMAARLGAYAAGDQNAQANQAAAIQRAQQILAAQQLGAQTNLGQQQIYQGSLANYNQANVGAYGQANAINAGVAGQNANWYQRLIGGAAKGAGSAAGVGGMGGMAGGGEVPPPPGSELLAQYDPSFNQGYQPNVGTPQQFAVPQYGQQGSGKAYGGEVAGPMSHLGRVFAGVPLPRHEQAMARLEAGGMVDFRSGGDVPGRAKVGGDSPKNDTVPAMVSPGEVVLPRSVMDAKNAPEAAAEFVRRLQNRSGKSKGYERVAKMNRGGKYDEGGEVKSGKEEQGSAMKR